MNMLNSEGQDLLFRNARSHSYWLDRPVDDGLLRQVYDLTKLGPTSANMCPLRIIFVKSRKAKERLKPALDAGNVNKVMTAPVTTILGMDTRFYEELPRLFPHADARSWFKDLPEQVLEYIALRNSSLQGAYLHAGRPVPGAGLRPDVGLQQRQGGRGVLCRNDHQIQFPVRARLRRCEQTPSTFTATHV